MDSLPSTATSGISGQTKKRPAGKEPEGVEGPKLPKNNTTENNSTAIEKKNIFSDQQQKLIFDTLKCIVCLDYPASPIHNCSNGHITCGFCTAKLLRKPCSYCKATMTVSFLGEHLAKQLDLMIKCPYAEEGCLETVKSTVVKGHMNICMYRDVKCKRSPCDGNKIPLSKYPAHLIHAHEFEIYGNGISMSYPIGTYDETNMFLSIFSHDDKMFFVKSYKSNEAVYVWAEYCGSKEEAAKFHLSVKVISKNAENPMGEIFFKIQVLPVHSGFGKKKLSPTFVQIPLKLLYASFAEEMNGVTPKKETCCQFEVKIM